MESLFIQLVKEAPNTVALLIVVAWFLKALNKQNERYEKSDAHSRSVIEANTKALAQVVEVMRGCPGSKE